MSIGSRWRAVAAVVLTLLIWPLGLVLLWSSPAWTSREKLIGSLPPGGLAAAWFIEIGVRSACPVPAGAQSAQVGSCQVGPLYSLLHPGPAAFDHVFGFLVFVASVVVPLLTAGILAVRLRHRIVAGERATRVRSTTNGGPAGRP